MSFLDKLKAAVPQEVTSYKEAVKEFSRMHAGSIDGSRNEKLNALAYRGGALVAEGNVEEYWVYEVLLEAAEANGYVSDYGEDDAERVIDAGFQKGLTETPQKKVHDNPLYDIVLTADQLGTLPPAEWLVDDLLLENSLAVLVGDPGTGKSFMAMDMAARIVTSEEWQGRRISHNGKVVYLAGEGLSGLNNRRMAWEKFNRKPMGQDFHVVPQALQAGTPGWDYLVDYVGDVKPSLTVIDTLAKTASRYDENTPADMSKYLHECDRLRVASGGTVLVIHHTNKAGGYRGGSSIKGDVDTLMFLYKEGNELELYVNKNKEGPEGEAGTFRLKSVGIGTRYDGKEIESAVFARATHHPFEEYKGDDA